MPHTWTFEIRNTVRDYPGPGDDMRAEEFYDHVNAMCFLLDAIPYTVVYGQARAFAQELLNKLAAGNPGVLRKLFGQNLLAVMASELRNVVTHANSDKVLMRTLYEAVAGASTPEKDISDYYRAIQAADTQSRLCIPFLDVQDGLKSPIAKQDMDDHIQQIGKYTLFDIYTKSIKHYPDLHQAVTHGKSIGAMGRGSELMAAAWMEGGVKRTGPGVNNRTCSGSGCVSYTGRWCNVDSAGNCTSGSM